MWSILGLLIGIFIGLISGIKIPPEFSQYLAIAILASLDSLVGAWLSLLQKTFNNAIFYSGFFINALLAAGLTYIGNLLGVNLSLAVIIVYGSRIFSNSASIRRLLLTRRKVALQKTAPENAGEEINKEK